MSDETSTLSGTSELLLAEVTGEFLDRLNRGEQPEIEEYAERHPEIAAIVRQVFPALQALRLPGGNGVAANDASKEKDGLAGRLGDYRSSARSAAAGWGSSTKSSRSRSAGGCRESVV